MGDGRHGTNIGSNGHKESGYEHANTKDVSESSRGRHSQDDKGDQEDTDDE